jgi:hypothetical protein
VSGGKVALNPDMKALTAVINFVWSARDWVPFNFVHAASTSETRLLDAGPIAFIVATRAVYVSIVSSVPSRPSVHVWFLTVSLFLQFFFVLSADAALNPEYFISFLPFMHIPGEGVASTQSLQFCVDGGHCFAPNPVGFFVIVAVCFPDVHGPHVTTQS